MAAFWKSLSHAHCALVVLAFVSLLALPPNAPQAHAKATGPQIETQMQSFTFPVSPGSAKVIFNQFDDQSGCRVLQEVRIDFSIEIGAEITAENDSKIPAQMFCVNLAGFATHNAPQSSLFVVLKQAMCVKNIAASDGMPGQGPDFVDFGFVSASGAASNSITTDLDQFIGNGMITTNVGAAGGYTLSGASKSTLTISDFHAEGMVTITYVFTTSAAGACCLFDASCILVCPAECAAMGGEYQGDGTSCAVVICEPLGACCLPGGGCAEVDAATCAAMGGDYRGDGVTCVVAACPVPARVGCSEKGCLLIFSNLELRWNADGEIIQDTFISILNDFPQNVKVKMYFVNGDPPLPADPAEGERAHPGWNRMNNLMPLTQNEPAYWSILTGQPKGTSPFTALDPEGLGGPGRPDPEGTSDRVLRGFLVAWAVDNINRQIRWNHLAGSAVVVDYREGRSWEYNACAFPVVDDAVANGELVGVPGILSLDGDEYAQAFDLLLLDFQASGSSGYSGPGTLVQSDTDLTLHPVSMDVRQETPGPITTLASFEIWNANEIKFTGTSRCITCWDQTLFSFYPAVNHFRLVNLQTDQGKARINGVAAGACEGPNAPAVDAALIGLANKLLRFNMGESYAAAGSNLSGMGFQSAIIRYDLGSGAPPEMNLPLDPDKDDLTTFIEAVIEQLRTDPRTERDVDATLGTGGLSAAPDAP